MKSTINVTAHRWTGGWEIHRDGEPITQVATLDQSEQEVRDYLDTIDPETNHTTWIVKVDPDLGELGQEVAAARIATASRCH